jgi:hypothetical protein
MIVFERKKRMFFFVYRVDEMKDRVNEPVDAFTKLDYA